MNNKQSFTEWMDKYGEALAAAGSACFIALAFIAGYASETLSIVFYALSYVIGGWLKLKDGLVTIIRDKDLDVNLLMIAAALGAASIGYWSEGAILIFIFALSGALETFTMNRSSRDISALMDLKPEEAIVLRDGQENIVPVDQLQVGETVLVKPGECIPADGLVREGSSAVDQASITGESVPVDRGPGDEVFAGTVNGQGALYVEVAQSSESSLFSKIIRLVQEAQSEMPESQRFIEKFERIYARVIILVTLLLIFIPPFLLGETWEAAFYRSMVFLVVASPCALVASIMPATLSAISNSARKGLLFKGGAYLDHISRVQVIAFDKTGTLTQGRLTVTNLEPRGELQASELLQAAAALESLSTHPIAKAIVLEAERDRPVGSEGAWARPTDFQARSGLGIEAEMEGARWRIGKPSFILNETYAEVLARTAELQSEGKTVIAVERDGAVVGLIALQDRIRPDTPALVHQLKQSGIQVAMLTGDQERTAQAIAAEAGIDLVYAELMPEDKLAIVKKLKSEYGAIAMVGDGVNDAPALAAANVGIAMGAAGSAAALETADLVLMNDDLYNIEHAISLGRSTRIIVKQNIIFSGAVIIALISANFLFGISLPLGVVGHEGSTILVILNGLRLLRS